MATSTLSATLNIAARALTAQQVNIQVISQNVANANTKGYHRQEAILQNGMPYGDTRFKGSAGGGQLGTGVVVERIKRYMLEFFDDRYRNELGDYERWEATATILSQMEATLGETSDDGLTVKLDSFFSSWQLLNGEPDNMALRATLRDASVALADAFNNRAEQLVLLREDQDLTIEARVDEINSIAKQLAELNAEIPRVRSLSNEPNDLLDERDRLLDRLTEISGVTANEQDNGELIVSLNGHVLVVGTKTDELEVYPDVTNAGLASIRWVADGMDFTPSTGELYGVFDVRDNIITDYQADLDTLAQAVIDQVNYIHEHGYSLNDPTGIPLPPPPGSTHYTDSTAYAFFTLADPPGSIAGRMQVSAQIMDTANGLGNIAAAEGPNYAPGDGNNALEIANLATALVMNGNSSTMNAYYSERIAELGLAVSRSEGNADDRKSIMDSLSASREEVAGVSSDEEAVKLSQAQKAYNAAVRVLTAVDDMMDRVINNLGRVGL